MVAEKSIVWRFGGVIAMIFSTSGRKPRSSISSASSRTTVRARPRGRGALLGEVDEPAGGADDDLDARCSASICGS
jgi:hypothetical protein